MSDERWSGLPGRLRSARAKARLTQAQLAVRADVGSRTVPQYETELPARGPDHTVVEKLGRALGVDPMWLLYGEAVTTVERDDETVHPVVEQVLRERRASPEAAARLRAVPLRAFGGAPDPFTVATILGAIEADIRREAAGEAPTQKEPPPVPEGRRRVPSGKRGR